MKKKVHLVTAVVWVYDGPAAWHFISIEKREGDKIALEYPHQRRGFGAIPVEVTVGSTTWKTSIFPDKEGYVLPLKKQVRKAENIKAKDKIKATLIAMR